MIQHQHAVQRFGQVLHGQNILARLTLRRKAHKRVAAARGRHLLQLDRIQHLFAAGRLARFRAVCRKALDKVLQIPDLFLALFVLVADQLLHQAAGFIPEVIVAHIQLDLLIVHIHDMRTHRIQKMPVMAHHDHRIVVVDQKLLQPVDGGQIQAVGGLVQQDHIWVAEKRFCQQHLHLVAPVHCAHAGIQRQRTEAQARQQAAHLILSFPAAHLRKLLFQLSGLFAVLCGKVFLGIQGFLFLHDLIKARVAHIHRIQHGIFVKFKVVLFQRAQAAAFFQLHGAGSRLQLAVQHAQQGGFSRAVRADDAVAVACTEVQVHILVKGLTRKLQAHVGYGKH